jgi:hypothetical protein
MHRPPGSVSLHGLLDYRSTDRNDNDKFITDCEVHLPTVSGGRQQPSPSTPTKGEEAPRLLIIGNGHLILTEVQSVLQELPCIADCLDRNGKKRLPD